VADPQTVNLGLFQPLRGSDVGTWDLPVNANAGALDTLAGTVAAIALTNAPVTLTTPPNSGAAWSGPYQSQCAILRFTGALSASVTVTLPRAGFWMVENLCTVTATNNVILASASPGNVICAPPGEITYIFCDGTNVKYVNLGRIGEYLDLGASAVPIWITGCTVPPYLNCDGTTFSSGTYPVLSGMLGGTTLPDLRGRTRAALNQGTNRITTAGSAINGNVLLSAGGDQALQQHSHANTLSDSGHTHASNANPVGGTGAVGGWSLTGAQVIPQNVVASVTGITISNVNTGSGAGQNMPPTTIAGLTLIRAG
jgi:hypothetical protein